METPTFIQEAAALKEIINACRLFPNLSVLFQNFVYSEPYIFVMTL